MVVFGQNWLYSGKSGSIQAKAVVFGQNGCIRARWFFWEKVVEFGQSGCVRVKVVVFGQKWLYWGKSGCNWAKWLSSG